MEFNKNSDLRIFAKLLISELETIGESSLAHEVREWNETPYMPSEFLGEFELILQRTLHCPRLSEDTKRDIQKCLSGIDEAFRRVNQGISC